MLTTTRDLAAATTEVACELAVDVEPQHAEVAFVELEEAAARLPGCGR